MKCNCIMSLLSYKCPHGSQEALWNSSKKRKKVKSREEKDSVKIWVLDIAAISSDESDTEET